MEKQTRQSNIELLRVVLIIFIIFHHIIIHGLKLIDITSPNYEVKLSTYIETILNSFFVIGVNCFVFISGYFGIKFNVKKIISIFVQAIFYSVFLYLLAILTIDLEFSLGAFFKSFFPIARDTWWFVTTYIGLYFIAPFLNAGMKNIEKLDFLYILLGLCILNCFSSFVFGGISKSGYDLFNFIFIYLIGQFMKQNELKIINPKLTFVFLSISIGLFGVVLIYFNYLKYAWQLFHYNNPILILSSISFFFIFYNLKVKYNKYINLFAETVLAIYMIHTHPSISNYLIDLISTLGSNYNLVMQLILIAILGIIFLLSCSIFELSRLNAYNLISSRISDSSVIRRVNRELKTFTSTLFH